jgi:segregation and condensation protein B
MSTEEAPLPDGINADPHAYARRVEAVLFAASEPLRPDDIRAYAGEGDLGSAIADLVAHYAPRGINLVERGGRYLFQTAPDCAEVLEHARETPKKLSRAALETLAIVAYHEPVTRAEIEEVRGVAVSGGTLDTLMEAGWVRPAGRRESPGRPIQFATTASFLAHFSLSSRRDLPGLADLKSAGLLDAQVDADDGATAQALAPEGPTP